MANIDECISLLGGPSDERRFVGLLLVAKLLPSEDCSSALKIWEAIGTSFLKRMLLPATSVAQVRGPEPAKDKMELHLMSCSVATAVLSSLCRFENISNLDQMLDFLPLISQVWRNRARLKRWDEHCGSEIANSIFQDILGTFLACASASEQGKGKVMDCHGIGLALWALKEWKDDRNQIVLMATNLISTLLEGNAVHRTNLLRENEPDILEAVLVFADLLAIEVEPDKNRLSSDQADTSDRIDPAMLQLEALQALVLVFPLPLPQAENLRNSLVKDRSEWWVKVRSGLTSILQSKTALVQRHSALQVAAAMTELMGSEWLVQPCGGVNNSNDFQLFRLLVEIVGIEIPVLLRDVVVEPTSEMESMVDAMTETSISDRLQGEGSSGTERRAPGPGPSSSDQLEDRSRKQIISDSRRSLAVQLLPICFWLTEAMLDVLRASEDLMDQGVAGNTLICGLVSPIDDVVALRTMNSVTESIAHILEYVSKWEKTVSGIAPTGDGLLVACARCVGCFLADIPIAHTETVKACLEPLLRCGHGYEGVEFMAPGLLQLTGGDDAMAWSKLCSRKLTLDAILGRAGFLCKQAVAAFCTQSPPADADSSAVSLWESKMGIVFHLIGNIFLGAPIPALHSRLGCSGEVLERATEWAKFRLRSADVDVSLAVALVMAFLVNGALKDEVINDISEKLVEEAMDWILNAAEIGHKGLVANEELFLQECSEIWERLVQFLTTLIEDHPKARSQAQHHMYVRNGIQHFDSERVGCVEDVSWRLFLKTVEMGLTSC